MGASGSTDLAVRFTPVSVDPIGNSVVANGVGSITGTSTSDASADGLTPDPDGSGSPTEEGITTTPPFSVTPVIVAASASTPWSTTATAR
ncbi:MAG: hypothetical protein R2706_09735 [Acidimicrobiales bacterium]